MSNRKELIKISYHNDDETGMHYVGEIDGCISDDEIDKFIKRFGDRGVSDLINHFAYLIYKFKDRQYIHRTTGGYEQVFEAEPPPPPPPIRMLNFSTGEGVK